ncbi:1-deoxy-D-xylulose-5-phosphate reductoisomerase [Rurimicrobium arvi]|uniref:1-deoxy-D-xylulose-5-phosphate reductoisomerase n=1 Tax=Rurimicrobium arvi TaxID=2049916 RepID=UPI0031D37112
MRYRNGYLRSDYRLAGGVLPLGRHPANKMKRIAILGSTGSIGTQALEVVSAHPDMFQVEVLSAHANADLLIEQAKMYKPNAVVLTHQPSFEKVKSALSSSPIKVFFGQEALCDVVQWETVDIVLGAIVGFAGLHSTFAAVSAGKHVALANKETLVVAGDLVMQRAAERRSLLVPVDSEHSALFQCLVGEHPDSVDKVILTASGGPFRGKKPNFLVNVKASHAMQHPNWTMGAKITIDSATLMNKGLEMIEAKWLFGLKNEQIDVVVHPQSAVHSFVQFNDGSLKAQLGIPDMKLPIQYAMAFPKRIPNAFKRYDFKQFNTLTFEEPDYKTFRNLALARDAMFKGGNMPCVLNAANEITVQAFLQNRVDFLEMSDIIEKTMQKVDFVERPAMEDYERSDAEARRYAEEFVKQSPLATH